jgi:hypothetical protein
MVGIYKGMRDLILKHLRGPLIESLDISDEELNKSLEGYEGTNNFINDLKGKIVFNKQLTQKQKDAGKDFFKNEKLKKTLLHNLDSRTPLGKTIIKKGIETYISLIKSGKKHLFKSREDLNTKIGTPSPEWVKRNVKDLEKLKNNLSSDSLTKKITFPNGVETTIDSEIEDILNRLNNDPESYPGFIEKNGEWSVMNKLDTHYSNWFRLIGEADYHNKLKGVTSEEKVNSFFKQVPIGDLLDSKKVENLKIIEKEFNVKIPTLSQADYEILREYNKDFLNIKNRLLKSSEKGDRVEANIKGLLKLFSGGAITDNDIVDFSSPGNRVDQVFSIDMLVNMYQPWFNQEKYWVPIQVKSNTDSAKNSMLLGYGIGGISVAPTKNEEIEGGYGFFTVKNGTEKSFQKLLQYNSCRRKKNSEFCKGLLQ